MPPQARPDLLPRCPRAGSRFGGRKAALQFLLDGSTDSSISVGPLTPNADGTQVTTTVTIPATAPIAGRVLRLTTAGGASSTPAGTGTNVLQVTGP